MSEQVYFLVVMCAEILLPLIPAIILFKVIPSSASVTGPFKGLSLKLGGAFAGFFVVFIALLYFFPPPAAPKALSRYEVWHVTGRASLEGPDRLVDGDVSVRPMVAIIDGRTFKLDIVVEANEAGALDFPTLIVDHPPCHASSSVDLNLRNQDGLGGTSKPVSIEKDEKARSITVSGIYLPLDPNSVAADGTTKCKP